MICDTIWICVSLTCFPNHLLLASIRHIKQHFLTCFHVHFKLVFLHIWMATFIPLISCIRIFISVPPVCQLTNIVKQTSFIYTFFWTDYPKMWLGQSFPRLSYFDNVVTHHINISLKMPSKYVGLHLPSLFRQSFNFISWNLSLFYWT